MAFGDFVPTSCSPIMMDGKETNLRFISGAGIYTPTDEKVFLLLSAPGIERHFCSGNWSNRFQPGSDMSRSPNYLPPNVGAKPGKFRLSFTVGTVRRREYKGVFEIKQMRLFGRVVGTCQSDALREHKGDGCVYLFEGTFLSVEYLKMHNRWERIE